LKTFQKWNKKCQAEFLNPPAQTYKADFEKIKTQHPFTTSIISKLQILKKKCPKSIETRKMKTDGFKQVDLHAYEKIKVSKSLATSAIAKIRNFQMTMPKSIQHNTAHITKKGLKMIDSHQNLPREQTQESVQAEVHVYEEIKPLAREQTQESVQAEVHVYEEIKPLAREQTQESVQAEVHVYEEIKPLAREQTQESVQAEVHVFEEIKPLVREQTQKLVLAEVHANEEILPANSSDFEEIDLHSNSSQQEKKEINQQVSWLAACFNKWF
jgi:dUTPase